MLRHSYSNSEEREPQAIREPGERSSYAGGRSADFGSDQAGVYAKEPDRQTTGRRGQAGRGRATMTEEDEDQGTQTRSRAASRGSNRRSSPARRGAERGATNRRTSGNATRSPRGKKSRRGFAAMSPEQQREIARKGGLTVSRNRRHMADIGRVGGEHSHGGRRARR